MWPAYRVPARAAANRISAELLCPYPPGVPAVVPGELLSSELIAMLQAVAAGGGKVTGAGDDSLQSFAVVLED